MTYKAAVIGLGIMGCVADGLGGRHPEWYTPCCHADAYQYHPRVDLVAGCSRSIEKRSYFQEKYPGVAVYENFRELLEKEEIDIISIATPATCHAEMVIESAKAAVKGIYCEKVMACSLAECDEMIRECESNNATLAINHQRRWDDRFIALKKFIEDGNIGDLQGIQISCGGGRLCRSGSHLFDLALYFADDDIDLGFGGLSNPDEFDPGGFGVFETRRGIRITIDMSTGLNHSLNADLIGEQGVIRIIDGGSQLEFWHLDKASEFGMMSKKHLPINFSVSNPMLNAVDDLIMSIEANKQPLSSGSDGRSAFEMITAIHLSHIRGKNPISFSVSHKQLVINSN